MSNRSLVAVIMIAGVLLAVVISLPFWLLVPHAPRYCVNYAPKKQMCFKDPQDAVRVANREIAADQQCIRALVHNQEAATECNGG